MDKNVLKEEFEYYIVHQDELVRQYAGKFIVLKNKKILGAYDSEIEAYQESQKGNKLGTFLIQHVGSGVENYTQTFYSQMVI